MPEAHDPLRNEEDVEEILKLALRTEGLPGQSLRERLSMSAEELGIAPEVLAIAEQRWLEEKQAGAALEAEQREKREFKRMKFAEFIQHLGVYAAVNAFLFWIDVRNDGRPNWVFWSIGGWGIAMAIHAVSVLVHGEDEEKEFRRWLKKRRRERK